MSLSFVSIGIDVSKERLDIHTPQGYLSIDNTMGAIEEWLSTLKGMGVDRIVCEASGGYEGTLLQVCLTGSFPICVVNAKRVRDFAKSMGHLAKTDKIDAKTIALFGITFKPPLYESGIQHHYKELVKRRRQLIDQIKKEKQYLEKASLHHVIEDIKENLAALRRRIESIESRIREYISQNPTQQQSLSLLTSCKGIGETTAVALLAELPELGNISDQAITALAGLAPFNRDSGAMRGQRHIQGGRAEVRKSLYMATISAVRFNKDIKVFYEKLIGKGKAAKVAIVACMRKLLITLNAIMKRKTPWIEKYS
jgi:transposase